MRERDGLWEYGLSSVNSIGVTVQVAPSLDEQIAAENAAVVAALQRKQTIDLEIANRLETIRELQARRMSGD